MADNIYVQQGKMVVGSSMIPYIRAQEITFEAENLRPGKIARLYFDDIVVNNLSQKSNKIVLNSKKYLGLNATGTITSSEAANYLLYQGPSAAVNTFSALVETYYSGNTTIVIKNMSGDFDVGSPVYIQNTINSIIVASANVTSETNANTSDVFQNGEGLYCANNNVYMTVISTSGEDILYVNQNYIPINIGVVTGNVLSSMTYDYQPGDIIYQTNDGQAKPEFATFFGRVASYKNATGANTLTVTTISGLLNVASSEANAICRIWNSSNTSAHALQARDVRLYDFSNGDVLISENDVNKRVTVISHNHNSGAVSNVMGASIEGGAQYLYLSSSNTTIAKDNLIYITSGTGMGQLKRVTDISGKKVTLNSALSINTSHTTKYSLGNHIVDDYGHLSGIFDLPEEPDLKFRTGERVFTITDTDTVSDSDASMKAAAKFTAGGLLNTTQRIQTSPVGRPLPETTADTSVAPVNPTDRTFNSTPNQTPITGSDVSGIPKMPLADGLSQTFFTPKNTSNKVGYGIFVTSVDLFFQSKPSVANGSLQLPVTVKLTEVVNGFPTKNYLATKSVKAKDVKISTNPSTNNSSSITKFTFDDPVYLAPDSEYAFVVSSESPEYELYIAELGGDVLGADPPRRISEQPYAGSLFRSQNATTWTPYQNEDLMFVINKAVFDSTGTATFHLSKSPTYQMGIDRVILHTNELTFPTGALNYKMKSIMKNTKDQESSYYYIVPHKILRYSDLLDGSNKPTSANYLNSRLVKYGNANSVIVQAEFASSNPDISPIFNKESVSIALFENQINNAQLSSSIITITNVGVGYNAVITAAQHTSSNLVVKGSADNSLNAAAQFYREQYLANNFNIGFYNVDISGGEGSGATGFAVANTTGSNTVDYIMVVNSGSGYVESPTVNIATGNAASGLITARAVAYGETSKSGGNILCKYLTRQITLEDGFEAGDIRVFMDAVAPAGTDIVVYYKVLGSEDPDSFSNKNWVRMYKLKNNVSKTTNNLVELEFHPDLLVNKLSYVESGIQYPIGGKFKSFAIKVGLLTSDPAIAPIVKNLRIIATPEG